MGKLILFCLGIAVLSVIGCTSSETAVPKVPRVPVIDDDKGKSRPPAPKPSPVVKGDQAETPAGGAVPSPGQSPSPSPAAVPAVRTRADGSLRVSISGAEFVRDRSISGLENAYRDPSGLIWGTIRDPEDNSPLTVENAAYAKKKCAEVGARLPFDGDFNILARHLGAGSAKGYSQLADDGITPILDGTQDERVYTGSETRSYTNFFKFGSGTIDYGTSSYRVLLCVAGGDLEESMNGKLAQTELMSFKGTTCNTEKYDGHWVAKAAVCAATDPKSEERGYVPQQIKMSVNSASAEQVKHRPDWKDLIEIRSLKFQRLNEDPTESADFKYGLKLEPDKERSGCYLSYYHEADILNWSRATGWYTLGKIGYNASTDELLLEVSTREWVHFCRGIKREQVAQQILFKRVGAPDSTKQTQSTDKTETPSKEELKPRPRPKR